MRTLKEFKARMTVGRTVVMVNHTFPELSGERTILAVLGPRWHLTLPETHPRFKPDEGSWLNMPKAAECTFDGSDSVRVAWENGWPEAGKTFYTLTVPAVAR